MFGLYGKTIEDQYQIDSLLCTCEDLYGMLKGVFIEIVKGKIEHQKEYQDIKKKIIFYMTVIEERYVKLGKKEYYLGYFSLADIYITVTMGFFCKCVIDEDILQTTAPNIGKLIKRIKDKELKEYYEKYHNQSSLL